MKRVATSAGFTIVEAMIVLAVTGLLFTAVAVSWGGKQRISEYQTALGDIQARIQQTASDVQNGYFPARDDYHCGVSGGALEFSLSGKGQGSNQDCIFLGKALQFKIANNEPDIVRQYVVAGRASGTALMDAKPTLSPYLHEAFRLQPDLTTTKIVVAGRPSVHYTGIAFLTNPGSFDNAGALQSGGQSIQVYGLKGNPGDPAFLASGASTTGTPLLDSLVTPNPAYDDFDSRPITTGITICFKSLGTNKVGVIDMASNGSTTDVRTRTLGSCPV